MEFKSTINYLVLGIRFIFILLCIFFLGILLNVFPFFSAHNPFRDKIPLAIIGGVGMCWGIFSTTRAIYLRTKTISIKDGTIIIHEVLKRKKKVYHINDITKVTEGASYDYIVELPVNYNGIKIVFGNRDEYIFIYYDYWNLKKLSLFLRSLKKLKDVSFI